MRMITGQLNASCLVHSNCYMNGFYSHLPLVAYRLPTRLLLMFLKSTNRMQPLGFPNSLMNLAESMPSWILYEHGHQGAKHLCY